jgi:uncharacterized protein YeaO (DUF488 family)
VVLRRAPECFRHTHLIPCLPRAEELKISIKRAYEEPTARDGYRVLVDRVWPRGRSKDALALDEWAKMLAPSTKLRKWFGHDPKRWQDFQERYRRELAAPAQRERLQALTAVARKRPVTLIYGASDSEHNQAVVLREILSRMDRPNQRPLVR